MCQCISQVENDARQKFQSKHEEKYWVMYSEFQMSVRVDYGVPRRWSKNLKRGHLRYRVPFDYCPFCGERRV